MFTYLLVLQRVLYQVADSIVGKRNMMKKFPDNVVSKYGDDGSQRIPWEHRGGVLVPCFQITIPLN